MAHFIHFYFSSGVFFSVSSGIADHNSNSADLLIDAANWYSFTNKRSAPYVCVSG